MQTHKLTLHTTTIEHGSGVTQYCLLHCTIGTLQDCYAAVSSVSILMISVTVTAAALVILLVGLCTSIYAMVMLQTPNPLEKNTFKTTNCGTAVSSVS